MPNFVIASKIPDYRSAEISVVEIDGLKCKTLDLFFKQIADELKFPEYFGHNLDAFDEMINDLTWLEPEAVIIIIRNFSHFLEKEESDEEDIKGLILSLLDQAADEQKQGKEGTPIKIIIEKESDLIDYLEENGLEYIKN